MSWIPLDKVAVRVAIRGVVKEVVRVEEMVAVTVGVMVAVMAAVRVVVMAEGAVTLDAPNRALTRQSIIDATFRGPVPGPAGRRLLDRADGPTDRMSGPVSTR